MTIVPWARSIALGWVALLAIAYGVEGPLLRLPLFGPEWIATAHLAFDCLTLAAAGWVAGRCNRKYAMLTAMVFAFTLCFWDFGSLVALEVPWLLRLAWNSLHDSRYFDSLLASVETHLFLFGCLFTGAWLSRPKEPTISIVASKKMLE